MARAYPELQQLTGVNFLFPWGREVFADYLSPDSPWLLNPVARAGELFAQITGSPLTAKNLATLSRQLEAAHEASQGLSPYAWQTLRLRQRIADVDLAYFVGPDLPFDSLLEQAQGADLVILHEPFQLQYAGPRFPDQGLEHLVPAPALLEETRQHLMAVNPEGRRACGLHIRRGDYAIWQEGQFFYGDQFWLDLSAKLIDEGSHVSIFTNDPEGDLCHQLASHGAHLSGGSPSQDLVRMMLMDAVYGPPSTFPLMARLMAKFCLKRSVLYEMLPARNEQSGAVNAG